jgi:hypothetical protein
MRALTISGRDTTVDGLTVDGNGRHRDPGQGWPSGDVVDALVYASGARNLTIDHGTFVGGLEDAIGAFRSVGVTIRGCTIRDNGTALDGAVGISFSATTQAVATGNVIQRNSAAGVDADPASSGVRIIGNRIDANAKEGIVVAGADVSIADNHVSGNGVNEFSAISLYGAHATTIQGNVVTDNHYVGVEVASGGGRAATGIVIKANRVKGNGRSVADQFRVRDARAVNPDWRSLNTIGYRRPGRWPVVPIMVLLAVAVVLVARRWQRRPPGATVHPVP